MANPNLQRTSARILLGGISGVFRHDGMTACRAAGRGNLSEDGEESVSKVQLLLALNSLVGKGCVCVFPLTKIIPLPFLALVAAKQNQKNILVYLI